MSDQSQIEKLAVEHPCDRCGKTPTAPVAEKWPILEGRLDTLTTAAIKHRIERLEKQVAEMKQWGTKC